ncbi:hypothetical protein [Eubacterium sp.]|uniref:hypothetical protein n=1 Tax=Eubacterium sp. TaxID=142586 RepID=UPI00258CA6C0|nr:hypothetical protein [Eubacterium sp.]MCR5368389.1 hypothetical protein [Eubacterium sp.]
MNNKDSEMKDSPFLARMKQYDRELDDNTKEYLLKQVENLIEWMDYVKGRNK